jgi:hypothetical protein
MRPVSFERIVQSEPSSFLSSTAELLSFVELRTIGFK